LRRLNAPDLPVATFRRRLRHNLSVASRELNVRRWRNACLATGGLSAVLLVALLTFVAAPDLPVSLHARLGGSPSATNVLADGEISVDNDREFIEAYYARQGSSVRIRSVDNERLVAVREFTLSDGQRMVVYTELGDAQDNDDEIALDDWTPLLASRPSTTF
jgi:hypothetical protein